MRRERRSSCGGPTKAFKALKRTGKEFPKRKRTESERVGGETTNGKNQEKTFAYPSDENFIPIKTPNNLTTSRFKLFTRIGSRSPSVKSQDKNLLKEDENTSGKETIAISTKDRCKDDLADEEQNMSLNKETSARKDDTVGQANNLKKEDGRLKVFESLKKYLDFTLCCNPSFVMMACSVMCMSLGVPHVLFFLPNFVKSLNVGADPATVLATTSVCDLLGRIIFGFILDADVVPKYLMYTMVIGVTAISVIALPLVSSYESLMVVMMLYGVGFGSWLLMIPLLLAEYFGVEKIGSSYGLLRLFQSISNLFGPLAAGIIKDSTGSFAYAFYLMGSIMALGTIFSLLLGVARASAEKEDLNIKDINTK